MNIPTSHLILGTAGHIDHGKTALVRALTGVECDTHKEEKQRGITIHLGFANLPLEDGGSVSIVDVPGHRDFIKTMVAGASGLDFCLLVIAADSGVMPQTREHLQIMQTLGVKDGLVALTKTDLVDEEILDLAVEEVRESLNATFLEKAAILPCSPITGQGMEAVKKEIIRLATAVPQRPHGEVFRLFIDRIFSIRGFGTVVTGSVLSGSLSSGSNAWLLPAEKELRVRRLERHGKEVDEVLAGDRASINLVGLNRDEFQRGMLISDRSLRSTSLVDASVGLYQFAKDMPQWATVDFLLGTYEAQVKIHLIDCDLLTGGNTAVTQIHLPAPCMAQASDRFVIRSTSSDRTLGGGEIIDAAPLHHRRRPSALVEKIKKLVDGSLPELVAAEVRKGMRAISHVQIAERLNVSADEIRAIVLENKPDDIQIWQTGENILLLRKTVVEKWKIIALRSITSFHKKNPLDESGRTLEELAGTLGAAGDKTSLTALQLILQELESDGQVKRVSHSWALPGHNAQADPILYNQMQSLSGFLKKSGMATPLPSELKRYADSQGMDEKLMNHTLRFLVKKREAYFVDGNYIHASIVDRSRRLIMQELEKSITGITVARFRDLVKGNRKICLLLLSIFDSEGTTRREGDFRFIGEKQLKTVESD